MRRINKSTNGATSITVDVAQHSVPHRTMLCHINSISLIMLFAALPPPPCCSSPVPALIVTTTPQVSAALAAAAKPKFCGKALNEVLDSVCVNGFYSRLKRSVMPMQRQQIDIAIKIGLFGDFEHQQQQQQFDSQLDFAQTGAQRRRKSKRRRRQRRLGIVHECCMRGCIYADIARYCR